MIVKIAACLYLLQALLGLWSMFGPLGFRASFATFLSLAISGLFAAIGVGLFKHAPWARWMALGSSLIGWTLGSLLFLGVSVAMFVMGSALSAYASGLGSIIGFVIAFVMLLLIASIVINYYLYFYLRSDAGVAEFGVERESFGSVMGSVGVWVVIAVVQPAMSTGDIWSAFPSGGSNSHDEQSQAYEQTAEYQKLQRNVEEQRAQRRAQLAAQERERLEAESNAQAQVNNAAVPDAAPTEMVAEAQAPAARYEPVSTSESSSVESNTEPTSRNQILKCRDASGAVQYTQGYCPSGTQRVDMPTSQ